MRIAGVAVPVLAAALGLAGAGCKAAEREPPPQPVSDATIVETVGDARRVASGDLDGDGQPELVMVDAAQLRVADLSGRELARLPAPGGIQVLRVADIDGDGRAEILAGWGQTRERRDAKLRISVYRLAANALVEEIVAQPTTDERSEVVELLPIPGSNPPALIVAYFESKYMVRIERPLVHEGRWTTERLLLIRMATSLALGDVDGDGEEDLVVGRVYGDGPDGMGDAFVVHLDGGRVPIPVTGGVRSIELVDLDGDGCLELLLADGWNKDYGRLARARLTRAWWDGGEFRSELLDESPDEFTLWDIVSATGSRDGLPTIVTRGSAQVRVLARDGDRWAPAVVASDCHDVSLLALDPARGGDRLIMACEAGAKVLQP